MTPDAAHAECILVVDDDKDIRESLVEILEEHGCHAVGAANGREAMEVLRGRPHADSTCLILLDLMMPVMDGRTFREEQLKRDELAGIPVVLISAFQDAAAKAGAAMNAAAVLVKPLQIKDVTSLAERFCACDRS